MKIATLKKIKLYSAIFSYIFSLFCIISVALDDVVSIFFFSVTIAMAQIIIIASSIKEKHKDSNNVVLLKKNVG